MHRDTVIGIVGVVILVAAMVGVFTYERAQLDPLPPGSGGLTNATGPEFAGTVAVGASEQDTLSFNQTGMTNVTFTLRWTAQNGIDRLRITVAPSNATGMAEGAQSEIEGDGEIVLVVPVPNTSPAGAVGVGDWQVTVEFVEASPTTPVGPPPVPPPIAPPGSTDAQVDFTLTTSVERQA